jgi:hypothetical protein
MNSATRSKPIGTWAGPTATATATLALFIVRLLTVDGCAERAIHVTGRLMLHGGNDMGIRVHGDRNLRVAVRSG